MSVFDVPTYPQTDKGNRCETCAFFKRIDSGYGWCTKNPPQYFTVPGRFWHFFNYYELECKYPEVPWNLMACGQFSLEKGKV